MIIVNIFRDKSFVSDQRFDYCNKNHESLVNFTTVKCSRKQLFRERFLLNRVIVCRVSLLSAAYIQFLYCTAVQSLIFQSLCVCGLQFIPYC